MTINHSDTLVKIWRGFIKSFYILSWIKDYTVKKAIGDFISGVTLGLLMVPQGIAIAVLTELPPQVKTELNYYH